MSNNHPFANPHSFGMLSSDCVLSHLKQIPSVIIPLSTLEPYGTSSSLGISALCIDSIAAEVASRLSLLKAPVLHYGVSGRYKAFAGSAGLKPKQFSAMLESICNDYFFQGFKEVIFFNSSEENVLALELLLKRYNNQSCKIQIFSIHSDTVVRDFLGKTFSVKDVDRSEFLMLSVASYLDKNFYKPVGRGTVRPLDQKRYMQWKKRGRDPESFKKMFPGGVMTETAGLSSPQAGKVLYEFIVSLLCERYSHLSGEKNDNATS
ncbi:MAG: creatininase family protein [Fibrobacter sp.]|nr:creatininase family protein [Fibrobacter sp.]